MSDTQAVEQFGEHYRKLKAEIGKVIIGQEKVVDLVLLGIFSRGHCLLVGVPGLAKTLLVNTVAQGLGLSFNRIQFTPDLMPSDIIGSEILDQDRRFRFVRGPIFANIILADEINRTPPKTQAALLEAMQEKAVTACLPPRTRSSKKALIHCPKHSWIASCSTSGWITPRTKKSCPS